MPRRRWLPRCTTPEQQREPALARLGQRSVNDRLVSPAEMAVMTAGRMRPFARLLLMALLPALTGCTVKTAASCTGAPAAAASATAQQDESIEFQTDEPSPSISILPHQVVVVVRVLNHDQVGYSFCARATLLDQQGSVVTTGTAPVTLAGGDGRLVRIDARNDHDRPVGSVKFDVLGLRQIK